MWTALATVYESLHRLPEAIESHTRALLGADRSQTSAILYKLATLHTSSNSPAEAAGYHRKIIALGENEGLTPGDLSASYLGVAEWEMGLPQGKGDWGLASQYLEKVANTNAPLRDKAEGMLRELRLREARLAAGHNI